MDSKLHGSVSLSLSMLLLLGLIGNINPRFGIEEAKATLPTIPVVLVTPPTTAGGGWALFGINDTLYFMIGYLWATRAARIWKTTDIGVTSPTWTLVADAPVNSTFFANSFLTNDARWLYGKIRNWTDGTVYYAGRLDLATGKYARVTHEVGRLGWTQKMNFMVQVNDTIYHANYGTTKKPTYGSEVIGQMPVGGSHITAYYNFSKYYELHVHSVDYGSNTNRLYFSLDGGAGYVHMPTYTLTWLADGGFAPRSMATERLVEGAVEIFLGSDHKNDTFLERYNVNGNLLNTYWFEPDINNWMKLFKTVYIHGDKAVIGLTPTGSSPSNTGWDLLSLIDGSRKWIVNGTVAGVTSATRFGNYIYSAGNIVDGDKIYMIDLSNVPLYDYTADDENIQLRYLLGGVLQSFTYANRKLTLTIDATSGTTSTTKVYCGDEGEPTAVYATNGTLTWSYNASTTILTLNVVHDGPANILVDWRIPGDVNGDDKVDYSDLFDLSKAYGSDPSKHNWNSDCDFNWDSKVDASDLFDLSENYGKTKT